VAKAGLLRIPASPTLGYDFLEVVPRTIQHYGVEVNGLRYNGPGLDGYRNVRSPYGGALAGKWPIRVNPDDVRYVWFQDPQRPECWHHLEWEHTAAMGTPLSAEAARYARRLAAAGSDRLPDPAAALSELLRRWDKGMVTDRRERRMALRLGAERAALPVTLEPAEQVSTLPSVAALTTETASQRDTPLPVLEGLDGEDDDAREIFDDPDVGFYADAFEVIE
jgi:hypothetical protein